MGKIKFLIDTKDDPKLSELHQRIVAIKNNAIDQVEFMKKRVEELAEKAHAESTLIWDEIKDELIAKELIPPSYSKEKQSLTFMNGESQLFLEDKDDEDGFFEALRSLLKK